MPTAALNVGNSIACKACGPRVIFMQHNMSPEGNLIAAWVSQKRLSTCQVGQATTEVHEQHVNQVM